MFRHEAVSSSEAPVLATSRHARPPSLNASFGCESGLVPPSLGNGGGGSTPVGRNSRHIPAREDMDMEFASFALTTGDSSFADTSNNSIPGDSLVDDSDWNHKNSVYRECLAERLLDRSRDGDDVLRFAHDDRRKNSAGGSLAGAQGHTGKPSDGGRAGAGTGGALAALPHLNSHMSVASRGTGIGAGGGKPAGSRKGLSVTKPEKILDAPDLPMHDSQYLSWNAEGRILIGLNSTLYQYDWSTQAASKVEEFAEQEVVNCVTWLDHTSCAAINFSSGPTVVFDVHRGAFVRTIYPPHGSITCLASNGHSLAAGSGSPSGGVFLFDLRTRDAHVHTYDGHSGPVHAMNYCDSEPRYLATGAADGCVRVWDHRRGDTPHYSLGHAHVKAVTAVKWSPDKRSLLMTGGADGRLNLFNTHKPPRVNGQTPLEARPFAERIVQTSAPISAIVWPAALRQVATCHTNGTVSRRSVSSLATSATFVQTGVEAGIACAALGPDSQVVCTAQHDEQLKFWNVFDRPVSAAIQRKASGSAIDDLADDELR